MFAYIVGRAAAPGPFVYTQAPRYDAAAGLNGGERFPAGAKLRLVSNGQERDLVSGFAGSADACVSFDGKHVLFSGKQKSGDPWQIYEIAISGGAPRRITSGSKDAIRPFYLPADKIVYSQRTARGFRLEVLPVEGGAPSQITFAPGDQLASDVLRDGRIVYVAPHPAGTSAMRDIYTVYPDGSGVETYRCDHGPDRYAARELSSGDIVFVTGGKLARFTSARAVQVAMPSPSGQIRRTGYGNRTRRIADVVPAEVWWALCAVSVEARQRARSNKRGCEDGRRATRHGSASARAEMVPIGPRKSRRREPFVPECIHVENADPGGISEARAGLGDERRRRRSRTGRSAGSE